MVYYPFGSVNEAFGLRSILAEEVKMPTASKDHIGSRQPQTQEQFVGDVLSQQLKEKGASTQPLERSTRRKGVDKALRPGEITTNEAEILLLWVQLRVI